MTKIGKKRKKESNSEHPIFFALEANNEGAIDSVLSG